jgi:23S rRNA (guanosine2251-2'-O)-methyltransferase
VIVYGRNPVVEAIRGRRRVTRVWATEDAASELRVSAAEAGSGTSPNLRTVGSGEELERVCGSPDHQGVCAEAGDYPYADAEALLDPDDALVVCLDQVQDPHNLGAVCRVAECAGATGVVIPERRSAHVTPAVCRASAGAVEHLPLARVGNLAVFLGRAKQAGAWSYGAAAEGGVPYDAPDYRGRVVVVFGAEGSGLRPRVAAACDELVSIPLLGRIESLNVSTAAAAVLYGILHLRNAVDNAG